MLLATTDNIGKEYEVVGLVRGNITQARHIGRDILAGLKTIIGGEIKSYSDLLTSARDIATERMIAEAEKLDADAVLMVRYATADVMQGVAEVLAYGTAVKFK